MKIEDLQEIVDLQWEVALKLQELSYKPTLIEIEDLSPRLTKLYSILRGLETSQQRLFSALYVLNAESGRRLAFEDQYYIVEKTEDGFAVDGSVWVSGPMTSKEFALSRLEQANELQEKKKRGRKRKYVAVRFNRENGKYEEI